eukprot:1978949-Amphidinium_carterae.1
MASSISGNPSIAAGSLESSTVGACVAMLPKSYSRSSQPSHKVSKPMWQCTHGRMLSASKTAGSTN